MPSKTCGYFVPHPCCWQPWHLGLTPCFPSGLPSTDALLVQLCYMWHNMMQDEHVKIEEGQSRVVGSQQLLLTKLWGQRGQHK